MEPTELIKQTAQDFLDKLEIAAAVSVDIDESGAYRLHIETEETGLLIGFHGRTLESFQMLIGMMMGKKFGKWERIYVNVGDYREKREEALMYMAQRAAERALASGHPVELSRLSPAERRVIHLTLSGDDRVRTQSEGEGQDRTLIISPNVG